MSFGLLTVTQDNKPRFGAFVNLNVDSERDPTAIERRVDKFFHKVEADECTAVECIPDSKDVIYCIPYLKDGIKDTAKMRKMLERINTQGQKIRVVRDEWKEREKASKTKTCYACKSKIALPMQVPQHNKSFCPSCKASDFLLTKASRTKIETAQKKIAELTVQYNEHKEVELDKAIAFLRADDVKFLIGGWVHESELPRDY